MASPSEPATAREAVAATPSDTTVVQMFDALWVGSAGDLAVRTSRGTTTTIPGVNAGQIVPVKGDKVMSTNTTAGSIVRLYY